jgi:dTDP-4-amino-4,6-dideoxygalactose transaminase
MGRAKSKLVTMKRINVTKSMLPDRKKFDGYVDRILELGWFTNRGALVRELEQRLAAYLGVRNLVLVSNGTLALQVAYKLLGLRGEVITTPFTFIATASSIVWNGLDVVFSDIDPHTFNLDPAKIEEKITSHTSAIVPVHVFGNPCEVEMIQEIAEKHSLKVIYDAAHTFGTTYDGKSVLEWGDVSTLSFHATKIFHTIEGGALIMKDDALCEQARRMINFGITGPESIECLGVNTRMNEFQAAMGLTLLDQMEKVNQKREDLYNLYNSLLGDRLPRPQWNSHASNNHHYYPVLFESEETLKRAERLLQEKNIFPRRYFYPSLDELDFLHAKSGVMKVSRDISHRILCLPFFEGLTGDDVKCIVETIKQSYTKTKATHPSR